MMSNDLLKKILKETGTFDTSGVQELLKEAKKKDPSGQLEPYLLKEKKMPEEMLYRIAASFYSLPYVNLRERPVRQDALMLIPEATAASRKVIAFDMTPEILHVATLEPTDLQTLEFIKRKTGLTLKVYLTNPASFEIALKQYRQSLSAEFGGLTATAKEDSESPAGDEQALSKLAEDIPIVRVVDSILEHAIIEGASDVHIEPAEKDLTVRYRVDGVLRPVMTFPKVAAAGIVARIKILSNLKLDEHRMPQDGRFKIDNPNAKFSIRVSVLPVADGEKIVMRLLSEAVKILTLDQLGFRPKEKDIVLRNIKKPHGMMLVTGPTGSGKSTTLYSVLGILNTPKVNISTIEDPIEYRMHGVNQSQVNPRIGFTFAAGLRALLRQDPNIIMVGEIRDQETAGIAVQAAMTGHLVLGTLHTNDSATSLPRLVDMGIPAFLIAFTVNMIVAQRLVRKVCPNCIRSFKLSAVQLKTLREALDIDGAWARLQRDGVIESGKKIEDTNFWRGQGCSQCGDEGYRGRIGIYEVLEVSQMIRNLITTHADADAIKALALKEGMTDMVEDGLKKAIDGMTSVDELLRVTKD